MSDKPAATLRRGEKGHSLSYLSEDPVALMALLNETHDVISVLGRDRRQRWMSAAFCRVFGYPEPPASFPADFVHPEDQPRVLAIYESFLTSGSYETTAEYRVRHADGSWRWVEVTARNRLDDPLIRGIVSITRDVTGRKEAEERLRHLASHDSLTGLANRSRLEDALEHAVSAAGPVRPVVYFVDLDGFKTVNDTYGHVAGDRVLQVVAARLQGAVRAGELVARYGGDEFVVVAYLPPGGRLAEAVADRIRAALADPVEVEGARVTVGASIGWAAALPGAAAGEIIKAADRASYAVKRSQRV